MTSNNDMYKLNLLSPWSEVVIIYISNEHFGNSASQIKTEVESKNNSPFTMLELVVNDWDKYLTPWKVDAKLNNRVFDGEAGLLLSSIEEEVIPYIRTNTSNAKIYIAGYSLAGLFSLWSLYESNSFDGAACCSGSVWYPKWKEYASSHTLSHESKVYLSLGLKEKNTKHPFMKDVEDNMKYQYDLISRDINKVDSHIDWHEGGHFNNTDLRMVTGISWLLG